MWPIEFIKRMIQHLLRGEVNLPERNIDSARRLNPSANEFPSARTNSTLTSSVPHTSPAVTSQRNILEENISPNKMTIKIELPITSIHPHPRRYTITMPKDMSIGRLRVNLANEFKVNKDDWKIVAIDNDRRQHILNDRERLNDIQINKRKRLYFYPNILE